MNLIPLMLACQLTFTPEVLVDPFDNVKQLFDVTHSVNGNIIYQTVPLDGSTSRETVWSIIDGNIQKVSSSTHGGHVRFDGQNVLYFNYNTSNIIKQSPDGAKTPILTFPYTVPEEPSTLLRICDYAIHGENICYSGTWEEGGGKHDGLWLIREGEHVRVIDSSSSFIIEDRDGNMWEVRRILCIESFWGNRINAFISIAYHDGLRLNELSTLIQITITPSIEIALLKAETIEGPFYVESKACIINPPKTGFYTTKLLLPE